MAILSKPCALAMIALVGAIAAAVAQTAPVLRGAAAYGDWRNDAPGVRRRITAADMPPPYASPSANRHPSIAARPAGISPKAPPGFAVELLASGLEGPRLLRVSPTGDIFVAESRAGRIRVLRATDAPGAPEIGTFADNLDRPFGIAFWPPGPAPRYVYVATTGAVFRFPYRPGELQPAGPMETVVAGLPRGGHWTRDIVFSKDGTRMFVSVGSRSNDAERPLGGLWDAEEERADILVFTPEGKNERVFASGLRNCVGMAVQPATGDLWCSVNERDGLGDDLPPDYVTRVRENGFYGWPWFYIGGNEDPRHPGEHADLRGEVALPDVLLQPHSAPLEITFYDGTQFPAAYRGDAFVAFHGSWNRAKRTGYKVVRVVLNQGQPTGEYEDFLTGFVIGDGRVWGRPVGVAFDNQGALLVSEDAGGTLWRVSYRGA
jgi:glucose/arabinose dehydrogenase